MVNFEYFSGLHCLCGKVLVSKVLLVSSLFVYSSLFSVYYSFYSWIKLKYILHSLRSFGIVLDNVVASFKETWSKTSWLSDHFFPIKTSLTTLSSLLIERMPEIINRHLFAKMYLVWLTSLEIKLDDLLIKKLEKNKNY